MANSISKILNEEIKKIKISAEEQRYIEEVAEKAISKIKSRINKFKINAEVFIGGSLAKNTIVKQKKYDVDIFIRFNAKYSEEQIKRYFKKIFRWFKIKNIKTKKKKIHGSRDYYRILFKENKNICIEAIPVYKILNPEEARNVTDLSYFHVKYIKQQYDKNKKLINETLLAKSFCHAQKCYGAESYINGFSGYALELLIIYYKSFRKFLAEMIKGDGKIIIDLAKHYKNKTEILENLSPHKTKSPIIIIDPTFKQRNTSGALSKGTFDKFKKAAKEFLENPSEDFFSEKGIDTADMKERAKEINGIFAIFEIKTNKQPGDIAGTKLLKFSKVFIKEIGNKFEVIKNEFEYDGFKKARIYFILKRKKEIIINGPSIDRHDAVKNFKKEHPIWYIEENRIKFACATDIGIKEFLRLFKKKNKKTIKQMSIKKIKII